MINKHVKAGNRVFFVIATAFLGLITAVIGMCLYMAVDKLFINQ